MAAEAQASTAPGSASVESAALEDRWRALHAESLATLRKVVSQPPSRSHGGGAALEPAFLAALPAAALDGLREAEALAREEHGATVVQLHELVAAHEALLEEMYAVLRQARAKVAMLSPESRPRREIIVGVLGGVSSPPLLSPLPPLSSDEDFFAWEREKRRLTNDLERLST